MLSALLTSAVQSRGNGGCSENVNGATKPDLPARLSSLNRCCAATTGRRRIVQHRGYPKAAKMPTIADCTLRKNAGIGDNNSLILWSPQRTAQFARSDYPIMRQEVHDNVKHCAAVRATA